MASDTGIGGIDLALAEGEVAGWVAAGGALADGSLAAAVGARAAFKRFAHRLARAHQIGLRWTDWLDSSTVVCRCEEVDYGTLLAVRRDTESVGLRSLKLTSRAGLGLCQGRICGRSVEHIFASGTDGFADGVSTDRRPIAAPIRLGELSRSADFVDGDDLSSTSSEGKTG